MNLFYFQIYILLFFIIKKFINKISFDLSKKQFFLLNYFRIIFHSSVKNNIILNILKFFV